MVLGYKGRHVVENWTCINYLQLCTEQVRSPYTEHAASGLPNPTLLGGGGYDLYRLKTSRWLHLYLLYVFDRAGGYIPINIHEHSSAFRRETIYFTLEQIGPRLSSIMICMLDFLYKKNINFCWNKAWFSVKSFRQVNMGMVLFREPYEEN